MENKEIPDPGPDPPYATSSGVHPEPEPEVITGMKALVGLFLSSFSFYTVVRFVQRGIGKTLVSFLFLFSKVVNIYDGWLASEQEGLDFSRR